MHAYYNLLYQIFGFRVSGDTGYLQNSTIRDETSSHPILDGVGIIDLFRYGVCDVFSQTPPSSPLLIAENKPIFLTASYGLGRVFVDLTNCGIGYYKSYDNQVLARNALLWLSQYSQIGRPIPALVQVEYQNSTAKDEWATITLTARNDGGTAEWQTIHCSFPDNPPLENVEIVSHDLNGGTEIYSPGSSLWTGYSEYNITSTYVMVEGIHRPWETGETHTMTVRVKPENTRTFTFYVKTVSRAGGITYYDSTSVTDQQDEYVYVYEIDVSPPEDLVKKYFPYFIFDEEEEYYPTDFFYDNTNITDNPTDYNQSWTLTCYVHSTEIQRNDEDYLVLEYWFYYAEDTKTLWPHHHDWESLYVYLNKDDHSPAYVTYFYHGVFITYQWDWPIFDKNGTHSVIHVARDSHASYGKTIEGRGIPIPEPCDGGELHDYDNFTIVYVDEIDPQWPQESFGTIDAPWIRTRWDNPVDMLKGITKGSYTLISMQETQSKLYLHLYDNQSKHVGGRKHLEAGLAIMGLPVRRKGA